MADKSDSSSQSETIEISAADLAELRQKAERFDEAILYIFMMMNDGAILNEAGEVPADEAMRYAWDAVNLVKLLRGDPQRPYDLKEKPEI